MFESIREVEIFFKCFEWINGVGNRKNVYEMIIISKILEVWEKSLWNGIFSNKI